MTDLARVARAARRWSKDVDVEVRPGQPEDYYLHAKTVDATPEETKRFFREALGSAVKKYSDDQPRDEAGRWTSGGVAVAGGEDMANAASKVVSLLRERFIATHEAGEYRWALNEYQKAWLGQSDWMTPEMADQAVRDNLIKTPNYTGFNDPTPERVDAVSEVVDSLKDVPGLPTETFPLPVFVIVGGSGNGGVKDAMGNSAETLNENVVMVYDNGTDTQFPEEPFDPQQTLPSNLQDVLLHEYGHAVQSAYGHLSDWETLWADYSLSDEYVPVKADNTPSRTAVNFERPPGGLSFYAGTNPAEGFAETFLTAVRISPEQYDGLRPEAKAMVDYVREKVLP